MRTTVNQEGLLNNYAPQVAVYCAEYPSQEQQQQYLFQAAVASLLVSFLVLISLSVS
ncbi:photosystem II assembly protein Psb34 [Lyngbya aestuarii]|uniref:photosystem II assembly protein Psb34 n=1 Tax=Lyngbya aestuarii TaxID=118322 RepID=UPI00403DD181